MYILYCLLILMLIAALCLLALPFIKSDTSQRKNFFIIAFFAVLFSLILYQFSGNKHALKEWLTHGEQHYQLQVEVNQLGGINQIIARIKQKLTLNPNDAQGWLILGKLYLGMHDYDAAKDALSKAHRLQPENSEINHYYQNVK